MTQSFNTLGTEWNSQQNYRDKFNWVCILTEISLKFKGLIDNNSALIIDGLPQIGNKP